MKRILTIIAIFLLSTNAYGISFGTYKSDYEYGLFDSMKFNWGKRQEGQKFIELRTETQEGRDYLKQTTKQYENSMIDENQQYKMLQNNTIIY